MTQIQIAKLVAVLLAAYPGSKATDATSAVYERMLADLDHAAAEAAIDRLIGTAKFLPTVAEIREAALAIYAGEVRPGLDAWGDVRALFRRGFSVHRAPTAADLDDPVAWDCLQAMGWREVCNSDETDPAPRSQFVKMYEARAATVRRDRLTESLPAVRKFLELRGDDARDRALPASTSDEDRRGAKAWGSPVKAGALVEQLAKAAVDG